jgi:hypothetical protein
MLSPVAAIEANACDVTREVAGREEHFDVVIATLLLPLLAKVARPKLARSVLIPVCGERPCRLASSARAIPLDGTGRPEFPFQGVVETMNVIPTDPQVTAWNTSVGLARETVVAFVGDLGQGAAAAAA